MDKPSLVIALRSKAKEGMDDFGSHEDEQDHGSGGEGYDQELHDHLVGLVEKVCSSQGLDRIKAIRVLEEALEDEEEETAEELSENPEEEKEESPEEEAAEENSEEE